MLSLTHLRVFSIVAALLLLPAVASAGQPADPTDAPAPTAIVPLEPVGTAGVRGRTMIAPDPNVPGRTAVVIEAEGLQPGGAHPVHLHAGSPTRPSAGSGLLGELVADATGRARLETGDMAASAIGETMALEHELLGDGWQPLAGSIDGLPRFQRRQE